jgi:hypothetical protein
MSGETGRLGTRRTLGVDRLLEIYDGIVDEATLVLQESQIAGPEPMPVPADELEGYLRWTDHVDPLPPDDLTEVPGLVLGKLFAYFSSWTNYVAGEVTRAKCVKDVQERNLKVVQSSLSLTYREQGEAVALIKDRVTCDERYVQVDAALLRVKVFYETAKSREDQLRRTLNNISREQTRRRDELERLMHEEGGGRVSEDAAAYASRKQGREHRQRTEERSNRRFDGNNRWRR